MVSRNRPATKDNYPKVRTADTKAVGLAMITNPEVGVISCNCGWRFFHVRTKVRDDRAEAHVNKKHGGQAVWL